MIETLYEQSLTNFKLSARESNYLNSIKKS